MPHELEDVRRPGPNARCTSIAAPMIFPVRVLESSFSVCSVLSVVKKFIFLTFTSTNVQSGSRWNGYIRGQKMQLYFCSLKIFGHSLVTIVPGVVAKKMNFIFRGIGCLNGDVFQVVRIA